MTDNDNKIVRIVTHSGSFHTDDCFATAVCQLYLEKEGIAYTVVRSRDEAAIARADIVLDVGGEYDPERGRFDHHQIGGAGERKGVPYSSFGLVWKHYGIVLCGGDERVWERIERRLAYPVDALDCGVDLITLHHTHIAPYTLHDIIHAHHPTREEEERGITYDEAFARAVAFARLIITREIDHARSVLRGQEEVRHIYEDAEDKRIIEITQRLPWEEVLARYPEPLFVVEFRAPTNDWIVKTVRDNPHTSFANRKDLPASWAGLRGEELARVSGVSDATFCHVKRFIAGARSREGALALARRALEE